MFNKKLKNPFKFLWGTPTNAAAGSLGLRAALDVNPEGERNRSYHGLDGDRPDSTPLLDEDDPEPSRVAFRERESGAQEPPVSVISTIAGIHDIERGDRFTGES